MQVVGWSVERVRGFASVGRWLVNYPAGTQYHYAWVLMRFMGWLSGREGFSDATPDGLVAMQKLSWSSQDPDAKYAMVDLLAEFVRNSSLKGRASRRQAYSILRGFFAANRASLPEDRSVRILGASPMMSRMTVDDLRSIVLAAKLRDRSWLLAKILGFMGWSELEYMNLHCGQEVVKQLRKDVVRIDFPEGRKGNQSSYYTLVGGSAWECLKRYVEEVRGPVRQGEAIWNTKLGEPMKAKSFAAIFKQLTWRVGLVPPHLVGREKRHGYGGHETRDIARSLWHRSKADRDCVEFMMGHVVDKNKYDKIYKLDPGWVEDEYRLALPHIDILAMPVEAETAKRQEEEISALKQRLTKMEQFMESLKGQVTGSIQQLER
mgnify:CR=1 FL=1